MDGRKLQSRILSPMSKLFFLFALCLTAYSAQAFAEVGFGSGLCSSPSCGDGAPQQPRTLRKLFLLDQLNIAGSTEPVFLVRVYKNSGKGKFVGAWEVEIPFFAATKSSIEHQCGGCSKLMPDYPPRNLEFQLNKQLWSRLHVNDPLLCQSDLVECIDKLNESDLGDNKSRDSDAKK
jgi:hypothetical protein